MLSSKTLRSGLGGVHGNDTDAPGIRRGECATICVGESGISEGDIIPLARRLKEKKQFLLELVCSANYKAFDEIIKQSKIKLT